MVTNNDSMLSPKVKLSPDKYKSLIRNFPLFCLLDDNEIDELFLLVKEVSVKSGTTIVKEGDLVDRYYLIVSGSAEVTCKIITIDKSEDMPVALLQEGDSIGLTDASFFSQSGIRTATVKARTDMVLLALNVQDFYIFLKQPQITYPHLRNVAEKILLIIFLKETKLFQHFSNERIKQFANCAIKIKVKAGEMIFKEGNIAEHCYFLITGQVGLFTDKNNEQFLIKKLQHFTIFGEGAFLDNGRRNASAKAELDCELFVIKHQDLQQTMQENYNFIKNLNLSRVEQIRPTRQTGVLVQNENLIEDEHLIILRLATSDKEMRISKQEYAIWNMIDGISSLLDIKNKLQDTDSQLSLEELYLYIVNMTSAGFLSISDNLKPNYAKSHSFINRFTNLLKNLWK
jgi:CRP-like cAMP-binding protein